MKEIFDYIEQHKEAYLEELFTFLRCKSISTRDEGVEECAELLAAESYHSEYICYIHQSLYQIL